MSLSDPRGIYGIHSVTPYNRTTNEWYGTIKVLKSSSLVVEGTLVPLMGGSSKFPWAVESGEMNVDISLKVAEYHDMLFQLFLGKAVTQNSAEASGNCSTLTNVKGTSVKHATTGIATATVKTASKADLKLAQYVVKAVSSTTVDVFASSDADFARGTDLTYVNDLLKITSAALTITASTATEVTGTGVELTGGSGTIGMTTGDTAVFTTRPINSLSTTVRVGGAAYQVTNEFGLIIMAQKRGNDILTEIDCFRCRGSGLPIGFEANAWAEAELKVKALYDSAKDGVFDFRDVIGA